MYFHWSDLTLLFKLAHLPHLGHHSVERAPKSITVNIYRNALMIVLIWIKTK